MESRKEQYEGKFHTRDYLKLIGVRDIKPATSPFDPGYDPVTLISHIEQSSHLISTLKISMACWQVANESATRQKIKAASKMGVPTCTGGGPFEVAATLGCLSEYLDLVADLGITRIEAGEGFTELKYKPEEIIRMAAERKLDVQFEVGKKHTGAFEADKVQVLVDQGHQWLDAGAKQIVIEARESAEAVGVFDEQGNMNKELAERFVKAYGLATTVFEAPDKPSQFAFLNHFGPDVHLSNVRIEELLRVEIYRRGLHSDAFEHENLRPTGKKS